MRIIFLILLLSSNCFGAETIEATGQICVKIVEAEEIDIENLAEIVFTENGATAQVVF